MLHTFEAVLKGNVLEWSNDAPKQSDRPLKVYVTLLEEDSSLSADIRRQKVGEIFQKIAASNAFASVSDAVEWQRELRQDRSLPSRDE
ncbi:MULTISPECIES: hypothetical protein [Aerosakkonema]|uniref:hypothetical protein n=1 Tax=Aerosakkonema TaxID=1246629 RepID=UPI0035B8CC19